jgi:hypothetical protein
MNAMRAYWASSRHKGKQELAVGEPEGQLSAHEKPDTKLTLTQMPQNEMPQKGIPEAEFACGEPDAGVPPETTASAYTCQRLRRLVLWAVLAPCLIGACLWLWGTYDAERYVTTALDEHLWRNFSAHVRYSVKAFDSKYPHNVLLVLFVVHALQVLFCFPLLHVTKMMYGYFFDALHGFLICCCWELTLVMVFVVVATQNAPVRAPARELENFLVTVDALRDRRMLIPFMVGLHISSVPLVTSTCLVLFRVVSRWEFMLSHTVSTVFTSAKDAWLGQFLATSDGNAQNILIAAMLLSFSALLPTVLTVLLMGFAASTTGSGAKGPWSASLAPKRTAAKTNPDSVRVAMVEL